MKWKIVEKEFQASKDVQRTGATWEVPVHVKAALYVIMQREELVPTMRLDLR